MHSQLQRWEEKGATLSGFLVESVLGSPYAWGIFVVVLTSATYGWSTFQTMTILAANLATFAYIMQPAGAVRTTGRLTFTWGGRRGSISVSPWLQALTGGLMVTAGYFIASLHGGTSYVPMLLGYGFVMGLGIGIGYGVPLAVATHWVSGPRRASRLGLVVAGFGLSSVMVILLVDRGFVPLLAAFDVHYTPLFDVFDPYQVGLAGVFRVLGGIFLVLTLISVPFLRDPEGYSAPTSTVHASDLNSTEMRATRTYRVIMAMGTIGFGAGLMALSLGKKFPKERLVELGFADALLLASAALLLLLVANIIGRWAWGRIMAEWTKHVQGDGFKGAKATLIAALAIQSAAVLALPATVTMPVLLIPNVVLIGLCFGAMFTLMPAAVINAFGDTYWAENYGYVFRSYGYGAIVVAMGLGGAVADFSMTASFVVTGVLLLAAVWLACMIRDEKKKAVDVRENGDAPRTAVPIQPASARRSRAPKPKRERDTSRPPSRSRR